MMNIELKKRIVITTLTALMVGGVARTATADEAALDAIHKKIERKYTSVQHMTSSELNRALADPTQSKNYVLFDVREVDEHTVSHLKQAIQVKPGIWTSSFMRKHGDKVRGKTVVFYCSVGRRSSYAASYLQKALKEHGARTVVNLKGGIFSWHNQKRDLSAGATQTPYVHPYDEYWGRLIERQSLIRFKPDTAAAPQNAATSNSAPSSDAQQTAQ